MFELAVTLRTVFGDRPRLEGIDAAASLGVAGVELYDWEANDLQTVTDRCDFAGVNLAATLSHGAGAVVDDGGDAMTKPESRETVISDIERSIKTCTAADCANLILNVGPEQSHLSRSVQRENIVAILQSVAPTAEKADVTLVIEPLNVLVDHPGYFLTRSDEAFEIIDRVNSTHVQVLFDVYHQQVTEGNIIQTLTENVEQIGHIHIADVPGRHQPGTGELCYSRVLQAIADTGYDRYVGCEFMPTEEPARAMENVLTMMDDMR